MLFGCSKDLQEAQCDHQAEITGQDFTRWVCGGGFIIELDEMYTIQVYDLLDETLEQEVLNMRPNAEPISVSVSFTDLQGSCGEYEFIKQLTCIQRSTPTIDPDL